MGWIILLIILGILLFAVELLLLPGVTVAAVGSFCCLVAAVWLAFTGSGTVTGLVVLCVVLVIITVMMVLFLRAKTWRRVALNTTIESQAAVAPQGVSFVGQTAVTLTRLAPMGKIQLADGSIMEARSLDSYIDPKCDVIITGFENSYVIVRLA